MQLSGVTVSDRSQYSERKFFWKIDWIFWNSA